MSEFMTSEIEDITTLALSTDEVMRRRSMQSLLGRVVERVTAVRAEADASCAEGGGHRAKVAEQGSSNPDDAFVQQQAAMSAAEWSRVGDLRAAVRAMHARSLRAESERDNALRGRDEAARYRDYAFKERDAAHSELESTRKSLTEEVQSLRGHLAAADASCDKWRSRAMVAEAANAKPSVGIDVIQQCLDGVLNDITQGNVVIRPDAEKFHKQAVLRLRSLAGVPLTEG